MSQERVAAGMGWDERGWGGGGGQVRSNERSATLRFIWGDIED